MLVRLRPAVAGLRRDSLRVAAGGSRAKGTGPPSLKLRRDRPAESSAAASLWRDRKLPSSLPPSLKLWRARESYDATGAARRVVRSCRSAFTKVTARQSSLSRRRPAISDDQFDLTGLPSRSSSPNAWQRSQTSAFVRQLPDYGATVFAPPHGDELIEKWPAESKLAARRVVRSCRSAFTKVTARQSSLSRRRPAKTGA